MISVVKVEAVVQHRDDGQGDMQHQQSNGNQAGDRRPREQIPPIMSSSSRRGSMPAFLNEEPDHGREQCRRKASAHGRRAAREDRRWRPDVDLRRSAMVCLLARTVPPPVN